VRLSPVRPSEPPPQPLPTCPRLAQRCTGALTALPHASAAVSGCVLVRLAPGAAVWLPLSNACALRSLTSALCARPAAACVCALAALACILCMHSVHAYVFCGHGDARVVCTQHAMHLFWEVAEFFGNTLVFFWFGVVIAERIWTGHNPEAGDEGLLLASDWGWAILNWVLLNVIRFVTLAICMPFMRWSSADGFDWKDVIVATWAGLRGAVGLALALLLYLISEKPGSKIDSRCALHRGLPASPVVTCQPRPVFPASVAAAPAQSAVLTASCSRQC
jgi:NhaP-type Na+/H+ or K+/H+ antiporter